ncbi:MAG TPA: lysophospholipid acyltransferase family protein [bacterium]|nr:lysophospholipid acyltransferase family protein [bacterium]
MAFSSFERAVYLAGRGGLRLYLRVGHGLQSSGTGHVPRTGGCLVAGNHPSLLDPAIILATCPRPVRFMAAEVLFKTPFIRWFLRGAGMIRVDRKEGGAGAFRQALKALQAGEAVGIFPHGQLVGKYEEVTPKDGAVQLAVRAGVPVVPVYTEGTQYALPKKSIIPRLLRQCAIVYGEPYTIPLTKADLKDQEKVSAATAALMTRIKALKGLAKNLTRHADYAPIAPFENVLRHADEHPEIWEAQARNR